MLKSPAAVLLTLLALVVALSADASDGTRGAFTVTAIDPVDASGCSTADGGFGLTFDATHPGTAPYDISTDNGATYAVTGAVLDGANQIAVDNLAPGTYALAVRDASGETVYPGYARIRGCERFACSPLADEFHVDPVAGATGYAWSTTVGSVAAGQNTTSVKLDLSAQLPNSVGELCVQPTGPGCTAPPTCFDLRVRCPEICDNGIDDDLDGDIDCADGDCAGAPTFAGLPSAVTIGCGDAFPATSPTATDNCLGAVAVAERTEVEPGPCADSYVRVRVFVATDSYGNTAEARQRVTVSDTDGPRFARMPEDIELRCGQAIPSFSVAATDACDVNVRTMMSEMPEPNATGCKVRSAIRRIWTATDNCGNVSTASQLITFRDDEAPALVDVPRVTTLDCGDPLDFAPPTTTDNCDSAVVVAYEDVTTPANCGLDIVRTWIATDACGNETRETQEIYVRDLTPPVFTTTVADVSIACGEALPVVNPRGVDACDPAPALTYDEFEAPLTGGNCAADKQIYRQWTLTDACGNLATLQQIVTVTDRIAPVFTDVPASAEAACAGYDPSAAQPTVSDGCGGTVDVTERSTETQRTRGAAVLTVSLRTWTATDACGNTATATQEIVYAPGAPTVRASTAGGPLGSGVETCAGGLVTLAAPAGAERYAWSTGATTATIQVRAERTRIITVSYRGTGPSACAGEASYTLRVGWLPCATTSSLAPCRLASVDTRTVCNDNDTPGVLADDTYAVFATPRGALTLVPQAVRISGDVSMSTAYLNAEVKLGEFPYTRAGVSFDVVSATDPICAQRGLTVSSPGACGSACELRVLAVESSPCADGQFDLSVRVAFANPAGALRVNGKRFALTGLAGERTLVLPNLSCTGDTGLPLELSFEGDASCAVSTVYDAACPAPVCLPLTVELGAP